MLTLALTSQLINSNGQSRPEAGQILEYTLTLKNEGTDLLTGLTIDDSLITFDLTGFNGELAAGDMVMLTGSYEIQQSDLDQPQNAPLSSTTTVMDDNGIVIAEQDNSTPLTRITVLQITKDISGFVGLEDGIYNAGDQVRYAYNVTNGGNATLFNVTLTDNDGIDPNASVVLSNLTDEDNDGDEDDLAVGATATGNLLSTFSQAHIDQGFVISTAQGTAFNSSQFPVPGSGSAAVQIDRLPAIAVVKTAEIDDTNGNGIADIGETVTYRYDLTNTGNVTLRNVQLVDDNGTPDDASDDITITPLTIDPIATNATLLVNSPDQGIANDLIDSDQDDNVDDLAVGGTATATYTKTITIDIATQAQSNDDELTNIVTGSGTDPNDNNVEDMDDETIPTLLPDPAIDVIKSVDRVIRIVNGQEQVLAGSDFEAGTAFIQVGDQVVYRYELANTGNVSLLNASIVDDNGTKADPSDDVTITALSSSSPNGTLLMDAMGSMVLPALVDADGDTEVDDLIPDGKAEAFYTQLITQEIFDRISQTPTEPGDQQNILTNIVTGSGTPSLPDGADPITDEDDAQVEIESEVGIAVVKTAEINDTNGNGVADIGETVTYSYDLTNTGNVTLRNVQLVDDNGTPDDTSDDITITPLTIDPIATNATLLVDSPSQGIANDLIDADFDGEIDDLAVGGTATATYTKIITTDIVTQTQATNGDLTNIVTGSGTDPDGNNVEAMDDETITTLLPDPSISLNKLTSADGINFFDPADVTEAVEVAAGETVYWRYEVTNTGNVAFTTGDLSIRDDNGTPGDTSDDFDAVLDTTSDANTDGLLEVGETWIYNASATAQDLSFSFDFDSDQSFSAGDDATAINAAYSDLEISTANIPGVDDTTNRAMIFDTANPTGGDFDLGTPGQPDGPGIGNDSGAGIGNTVAQGNVLIISEDGDSSDPDDNADGGTLNFAWTNGPVRLTSVGLLDIDVNEEMVTAQSRLGGADVQGYDAQNLGDNSHQTIALGGEWADQLAINFVHSGAVTGLAGIGSYSNRATVSATFNGSTVEASADSYYTNSIPAVVASPVAPAPVTPAAPTEVLFVTGNNNAQDQMLQQQLSDRGFNVMTIDDEAVTSSDDDGKDLIVISESVLSGNVGDSFTDSTAAVMTWEAYLYDDLGMTGLQADVDFGWTSGSEVISGGDSLAVYEGSGILSWARPGSEANTLATLADGSDRAAIFAYDSGAMLSSGVEAAGKRVGFFAHSYASSFSEEGLALFNTAVDYAVM